MSFLNTEVITERERLLEVIKRAAMNMFHITRENRPINYEHEAYLLAEEAIRTLTDGDYNDVG
jgi:hypothetical protein